MRHVGERAPSAPTTERAAAPAPGPASSLPPASAARRRPSPSAGPAGARAAAVRSADRSAPNVRQLPHSDGRSGNGILPHRRISGRGGSPGDRLERPAGRASAVQPLLLSPVREVRPLLRGKLTRPRAAERSTIRVGREFRSYVRARERTFDRTADRRRRQGPLPFGLPPLLDRGPRGHGRLVGLTRSPRGSLGHGRSPRGRGYGRDRGDRGGGPLLRHGRARGSGTDRVGDRPRRRRVVWTAVGISLVLGSDPSRFGSLVGLSVSGAAMVLIGILGAARAHRRTADAAGHGPNP